MRRTKATVFKNGYYYYNRGNEGKTTLCTAKGSLNAAEEVLLDVNKMAEGHNYFQPPVLT